MTRLMSEVFLAGFAFSLFYGQAVSALTPNKTLDPSCDAVTADNPTIPTVITKKLNAPDTRKYAFYFQRKYTTDVGVEKKLIFKISSDNANEDREALLRRLDKQTKPLNWLMEKNMGEKPSTEPPQLIAWPADENDANNQAAYQAEMREKFCAKRSVASY